MNRLKLNRRDNINSVREMRKSLSKMRNLTLENFILPDEDEYEGDEMPQGEEIMRRDEEQNGFTEEIKQAIVQIRKISISVIAKLADNPMSEGYTFMKRVLDMSDKAMESINNGNENKQN